ncbi:SusC/RagA family TonB-linked outer membrane protein [Hymenobacter sp. CRA2]|uniref:SusC/RagA family TonB-linked outer membrane protein n=1 Tax=Hymenobacter sp. CRA2 TaxID=1955620 RepID=UPI00098E8CAF|nr:SusC/RagA family TonB-linked outer membrane protein [Hymenobacter sp. CRA2]OON69136.1 hypothetical protein B0919_10540 [Hymenobacter sp. CRA2]
MGKLLLSALLTAPLMVHQVAAQTRTVSGRVTDATNGQGLPGVTVIVKGTTNGTSTNAEGSFSLEVPAGATVSFSSIGYRTIERVVGNSSVIDVALGTDTRQLSEVVVTAVGIERQEKSLGYSVDVISNRSLTQGKETNPIAALQGKVAGVQITRSSGGVNSSQRITLRGQRSLQQDNQPLFVVDGIPIDNSSIQPSSTSANTVDVGNRVGDINPEDIESMTVLKGPSAAALYGSRASNGAIIITTKTGRDAAARGKKSEVTLTSSFTAESILKLPEFQNEFGSGYAGEYIPYENTSWGPRFDGSPVQLGPPAVDGSIQTVPFSPIKDNVRNFFNTGTTFQNTVSLQGGNEKTNYYLSFSDATQKGIVPDDKFRRNTVKFTAGTQLSNKISASTSINYNHNKTDITFQGTGNTSVLNNVINTPRFVDLKKYKDYKNDKFSNLDGFYSAYYDNPWFNIGESRFTSDLDRVIGNATLNYAPLDWLSFTYRAGTDVSFDRRKERAAIRTYISNRRDQDGALVVRPANFPGRVTETDIYIQEITTDLLATIKRNITPDISAQLILGQNLRQRNTRQVSASASALSIPGFYNLSNRVGELGGSEESVKTRLVAGYADLTLGYKDFLFLNATARNDWSSTLSRGNRSYFFPSASLGFVFTEAIAPLKDNKILSYGKIRVSYAQVGNGTGAYNLENTFPAAAGFPYGALASFTVSDLSRNRDIRPELTTNYEGGIEFAMFDDRISGDATYYKTLSRDLITSIDVPTSTGFTQAVVNIGEVENTGLELSLRTTPIRTQSGFRVDIGANFSKNDSKVNELFRDVTNFALGGGDPVPTAIVGQPFPVLKGSGYQRDPEGRVVVDPVTGVPLRDAELKVFGQVNPKYILGGTLTVSYKGLRLSSVVDMRRGNVFYSGTRSTLAFTGTSKETAAYGREPFVFPNSVTRNADGTYTPNTTVKTFDGGYDFWYDKLHGVFAEANIVKADFFKLREVSLTYDLPRALMDKTPFGRVQVGVSGRNLLLFTPKSNEFVDPEANIFGTSNSQGREFNTIPSTRSYGANLTVTF